MSEAEITIIVNDLIDSYKLSIDISFRDKLVQVFFHANYEYQDIDEFMESLYLNM